ncbi:PREDICTED: uncharacterized protein LOC107190496 [Dufourea novaeangliae]|uniref:Uncharacterized protein n=1 Tax=Dufourea novaeangliae TaxID=178035 RepID=A0A154PKJ6_DUFNO|nr:PREDICTED: uncharacterized protein LOC107190496 [Dufourea novaeangliae]KZC12401.1 hypothetical protein WN55_03938 [Dufourea novaeangliae]
MELSNEQKVNNSLVLNKDFLQTLCNWKITNNKQFHDVFTTTTSSKEEEKTNIDDIVNLYTCISLQPTQSTNESCMLEIKLSNRQKISCIAIVSEAYVLEVFKESGEYKTTIFAELVDEFQDNSVYLAETKFIPPTSEASIKFTKTKSKDSVIWVYGIMLYLTEPTNESTSSPTDIFNPEIIKHFLSKLSFNNVDNNAAVGVQSCYKNILNSSKSRLIEEENKEDVAQCINDNAGLNMDIKMYIDNKFHDIEIKLMKRIDEMEQRTNEKLDSISKQLEIHFNSK